MRRPLPPGWRWLSWAFCAAATSLPLVLYILQRRRIPHSARFVELFAEGVASLALALISLAALEGLRRLCVGEWTIGRRGLAVSFGTSWRELPPGWRWVAWMLGGAIFACPLAIPAGERGLEMGLEDFQRSMAWGLPGLGVYALVVLAERHRGILTVLSVLGGLLLATVLRPHY